MTTMVKRIYLWALYYLRHHKQLSTSLPKIMSSLICGYCLRNNFKSQRGLDQHQQYSRTCNPEARASRIQLSQHQPHVPANNGQSEEIQDASLERDDLMTGDNPRNENPNLPSSEHHLYKGAK